MSEPQIKEGYTGHAVVILQEDLSDHGYPVAHDGVFGPKTLAAVRAFQEKEGIAVDGIVGPVTWAKLGIDEILPPPAWGPAEWALWYWRHQLIHHDMHYAETRPMDLPEPPAVPHDMDCSTFATLVYKDARLPDPNGNGYNGEGNTTTLLAHGSAVPLDEVRAGDLVFYSAPEHVAVAVGGGYVVSMGHEGDPSRRPVGYRIVTAARHY